MPTRRMHSRNMNCHRCKLFERFLNRCIHLASSGKTKKEKENLRNQAKTQLALCQQSGLSSYELVFLVAYLQFKSNDFARALTTILAIPEVRKIGSIVGIENYNAFSSSSL